MQLTLQVKTTIRPDAMNKAIRAWNVVCIVANNCSHAQAYVIGCTNFVQISGARVQQVHPMVSLRVVAVIGIRDQVDPFDLGHKETRLSVAGKRDQTMIQSYQVGAAYPSFDMCLRACLQRARGLSLCPNYTTIVKCLAH